MPSTVSGFSSEPSEVDHVSISEGSGCTNPIDTSSHVSETVNNAEKQPAQTASTLESAAARLNRQTVERLQWVLDKDPEADLRDFFFPKHYAHRMLIAGGPSTALKKKLENLETPDFREKFDLSESASVAFPLSCEVVSLLCKYDDYSLCSGVSLLRSLVKLIWDSPKLWENPVRGIVVKCSDHVVAKVLSDSDDYTEYSALQYLAKRLPEVPAPKPLGVIRFSPFRVIFMSYIPSMTLSRAWPSLSHDQKLSVQSQLNDIFSCLRGHQRGSGYGLGGLGGEGVKDLRRGDEPTKDPIETAEDFENFQFSAAHRGSKTYVTFLRSLLDDTSHTSIVLTHGDVHMGNIMVDVNGDSCKVTGLIDWEESGFYPAQYECMGVTRTLSVVDENDWYLYLPSCISPSRFPVQWLVDRLWGILVTKLI